MGEELKRERNPLRGIFYRNVLLRLFYTCTTRSLNALLQRYARVNGEISAFPIANITEGYIGTINRFNESV